MSGKTGTPYDRTYGSPNGFVRSYFWSRIRKASGLMSDGSRILLDLGCGEGPLLEALPVYSPDFMVVELDAGEVVLSARRHAIAAELPQVEFVLADAYWIPLRDSTVDTLFAISILEHLEDHRSVCGEMARVLSSGGELIVGLPTETPLYRMGRRVVGFTKPDVHAKPALVEAALGASFRLEAVIGLPIPHMPRILQLYTLTRLRKH
jgi:ubiquinone/menaquinone biosynthesis C-methylase UbiE